MKISILPTYLFISLISLISYPTLAQSPANQSCETVLSFDGVNEYVYKDDVITTETQNITLEAWFKWNGANGNSQYIVTNGNGNGYGIFLNSTGRIDAVLGGVLIITGTKTANPGEWTHVALVRTNTTTTLYVNGEATATSTATPLTPDQAFVIGASGTGSNDFFKGSIDEVRLWGVALTPETLIANSSISLEGTEDDLLAYWNMNEKHGDYIYDKTINDHTCNLVSMEASDWIQPDGSATCPLYPPNNFCETALEFDGTDDYLTVKDYPRLQLTNSFTIEFWFKTKDLAQSNKYVVGRISGDDDQWAIIYGFENKTFEFYAGTGGYSGADPRPGSGIVIADTLWHHIAYTYGNNVWSGYLDDKQIFSLTRTFNLLQFPNANLLVGGSDLSGVNNIAMQMDELRIWSIPRNTQELHETMEKKIPLSNGNNLEAYWDFDEFGGSYAINRTGNVNRARLINMNQNARKVLSGNTFCNFGTHNALAFDGEDDFVEIADHSDLDLTDDFTLEAWIKPATMTDMRIIDKCPVGGTNGYILDIRLNKLRVIADGLSNGGVLQGVTNIPANVWTHVAVTFKSGVTNGVKLYVNGELDGEGTANSVATTNNLPLRIGTSQNQSVFFQGEIDEVRLWSLAQDHQNIQILMNMETIAVPDLIAYYHFNDGIAAGENVGKLLLNDQSELCHTGLLKKFQLSGTTSNWVKHTGTELTSISYQVLDLEVSGNSKNIINGDDTPATNDGTDFGNQVFCAGEITKYFLLENKSVEDNLIINSISITGEHAADFSITSPTISSIAPFTQTLVEVTFNPSAIGIRNATITIASNDCDEGLYTFDLMGTGIKAISVNDQTNLTCSNDTTGAASVMVTGMTGNITYDWTPGSPQGDGTADIVGITPGVWRCTVTDENACTDFIELTITTEYTAPTVTASISTEDTICLGTELILTGSGAATYTWSDMTGNNPLTDGVAFTPEASNTYTVIGTDDNGCKDTAEISLTVKDCNQIITFEALSIVNLGSAPFQLNATASSGLAISYTSSNTAVATIDGDIVSIIGIGSTIITANQAGGEFVYAATPVQQTLIVKANQSITFNPLTQVALGSAPFKLNATSSSGLAVSYTSSNAAVATIDGDIVSILGIGSTIITANQTGSEFVYSATPVQQTLIVKTDQSITFNPLGEVALGSTPFKLSATTSSGLALTYISSNTAVATIDGDLVTLVGIGSTVITANQAGADYINPASAQQTLTVKMNQQIVFDVITAKMESEQPFMLTGSSTSSLPLSFTSLTPELISISGNQATIKKAGRASIQATQEGNNEYFAATALVNTFCIKPKQPLITKDFTNPEVPILTSSATDGNQWYKDGVMLMGAIQQQYTTQEAGSYTVQVTADDCVSVFSEAVILVITNAEKHEGVQKTMLYPVPASEQVTIAFQQSGFKALRIIDATGKILFHTATDEMETTLQVHHYTPGAYWLIVETVSSGEVLRFIKK
jgi:hypothetical protein